ncbi:hypothetical protein GCM10023321_03790 [Pseudonocardia eucalypti]|uniref:Protein kinase domain-containing protein n=1 Tax=Pseudonocardia eucalypti TaxID=648755 RepID=A0ABP9PIU6_9PSEU
MLTVIEQLRGEDPAQLGPFWLVGRLGAGGMGQVYLGRTPDGRLAAVKAVHGDLCGDPTFRERFAREIDTASRLRAPWTVPIVAADPHAPRPWLATEYVPGPSLEEYVAHAGPLPAATVGVLAGRMAEALAAVHALGIAHRDLKPSNLLLAPDGPRLVDFGIAHAAGATKLTATGMVVGTPAFMSPEQANGLDGGPASDVFSLASTLVFGCTGKGPFGVTGNPVAMLYRITDAEPELAGLPEWLREEFVPCLAKDPEERPSSRDLAARFAPRTDVPGGWPPPGLPAAPPAGMPVVQPPGATAIPLAGLPTTALPGAPTTPPPSGAMTPPGSVVPLPGAFLTPRPGARVTNRPLAKRPAAWVGLASAVALLVLAVVFWPSGPAAVAAGPPRPAAVAGAPAPVPGLVSRRLTTVSVGSPAKEWTEQVLVGKGGAKAYLRTRDGVYVLDTASNTVTVKIDIDGTSSGMALSSDGQRLGVVTLSNFLTVIDTAAERPVGTFPLAGGPGLSTPFQGGSVFNVTNQLALSSDGRVAYVVNTASGAVALVDTASGAVTGAVPVGPKPFGIAVTPDGRRLLVGVVENDLRAVAVVDTAGRTKLGTVMLEPPPVPNPDYTPRPPNRGPETIVVAPDGGRAYISKGDFDGTLDLVDVNAVRKLGAHRVQTRLEGLAFSPSGRYLYGVPKYGKERRLVVVDTANGFVVERVDVGLEPSGCAVSPDGRRAYVAGPGAGADRSDDPGAVAVVDISQRN